MLIRPRMPFFSSSNTVNCIMALGTFWWCLWRLNSNQSNPVIFSYSLYSDKTPNSRIIHFISFPLIHFSTPSSISFTQPNTFIHFMHSLIHPLCPSLIHSLIHAPSPNPLYSLSHPLPSFIFPSTLPLPSVTHSLFHPPSPNPLYSFPIHPPHPSSHPFCHSSYSLSSHNHI